VNIYILELSDPDDAIGIPPIRFFAEDDDAARIHAKERANGHRIISVHRYCYGTLSWIPV